MLTQEKLPVSSESGLPHESKYLVYKANSEEQPVAGGQAL